MSKYFVFSSAFLAGILLSSTSYAAGSHGHSASHIYTPTSLHPAITHVKVQAVKPKLGARPTVKPASTAKPASTVKPASTAKPAVKKA